MKRTFTFVLGALLCLSASVASAQDYSLNLTAYKQEQTQWCWAATTRMIDWAYSSTTPPSQCSIVNAANNTCDGWFNVCCNTLNGSRPSACTDPLGSNFPNSMSGCNGSLSWLLNNYAGANTSYSSSLAYSTVRSNLGSKKMMVARWGWTSGGGHFVVIYGNYTSSTGTNYIRYANPASGSKTSESDAYFRSNSSRTWTHSIAMNGGSYQRTAGPTVSNPVISNDPVIAQRVSIYPNPTEGAFQLLRNDEATVAAKITITNTIGDVVYETEMPAGQREAALELKGKLSAGLYLVNLVSNGERTVEKLVIR
ncbi:T9SS type A sorting domain-containing protein [Adhaeribacter sp. BT258]|uniref:T9SS type A sorting domain-containing protein n=1 Tax=Adhaeribacter terrigena TaxID=2793070 RepID=A0ABS1C299_9BACT|nr:T9SS type A sorting domain-containing protein [Adhaeribacter terrigena]MBK0403527.1 T9SS type A sorting domain-containing protein [Adhaeribacter terrigena]